MEEVSQLPMRDKNLGGEEETTSAEDDGGDVVTEIKKSWGINSQCKQIQSDYEFVCLCISLSVVLFV